jgi:hypothetical protein
VRHQHQTLPHYSICATSTSTTSALLHLCNTNINHFPHHLHSLYLHAVRPCITIYHTKCSSKHPILIHSDVKCKAQVNVHLNIFHLYTHT